MSSINKLSSIGCALGLTLGVTFSGAALATGPIIDTFTGGNPLTAAQMNNIKNAVNDLQGNVPSTSCRVNAGTVDAGATRVGPLCVENATRATAFWSAAVATCNTAGKRLLTPGEYMAAKAQAAGAFGMTNGVFEWVDSVSSDSSADITLAGGSAGRLTVGYMGPDDGTNITAGDVFYGNNAIYDATHSFVYRCAR